MSFEVYDREDKYIDCECCRLVMDKDTADYKYSTEADAYLCWDCFHNED